MAIQDILNLETCFELDNVPKNFKLTDLTDYASEGIDPKDTEVLFKITGPLGVIYENTDVGDPDILEGQAIDGVNQGTKTFTINNADFTSVFRDGEEFTILNSTGNDGVYTIVSTTLNGSDTDIVVVETIPSAVADGQLKYFIFTAISLPLDVNGDVLKGNYTIKATVIIGGAVQAGTYIKTDIYDFCYTSPDVKIEPTIDCFCSIITSKDLTDYGLFNTTLTRVHTVFPPPASTLTPTSNANVTIVVGPSPNIVTGTWSTKIVTDLRYDFTDGLCVIDQVSGSDEYVVDCDLSLCDVFCCVQSLLKSYQEALLKNPTRAQQIQNEQLIPVISSMVLFQQAIQCGDTVQASVLLKNILDVSGCEAGCGCEDDDLPKEVIPFCGVGAGADVIVAEGSGITVVANTVGDTTTYTVSIEATLKTKIDNLRNTIVASGSDINVVPTGTDPITYTVNFDGTIPVAFPALTMSLEVTTPNIRGNGTTPIYTGSVSGATESLDELYKSTGLTTPAEAEYETAASDDGIQNFGTISNVNYNNNIYIKISGFVNPSNAAFTYNVNVSVKGRYDSVIQIPINVVGHFQENNNFIFKLIDTRTGNLMQWYDLVQILDSTQTLLFTINVYIASP